MIWLLSWNIINARTGTIYTLKMHKWRAKVRKLAIHSSFFSAFDKIALTGKLLQFKAWLMAILIKGIWIIFFNLITINESREFAICYPQTK